MAHSVEIPYLDKVNIEIYLNDLAVEIEKANIGKHSILIVGGAAMALKYEDQRSTVDIDICFREQQTLLFHNASPQLVFLGNIRRLDLQHMKIDAC